MSAEKPTKTQTLFLVLFIPPALCIAVLCLPIIAWFFISGFFSRKRLTFLVRKTWFPQGKRALIVYSDSPHWKMYFEETVFPQISEGTIIHNWSKRSQWDQKDDLPSKVFHQWAGTKEFCPVAIIFHLQKKPTVVRFWEAFKEAKHGKPQKLKACEQKLFEALKESYLP